MKFVFTFIFFLSINSINLYSQYDFKYIGNFVKKIDGKYTDFYFELLPEIELDMEELEELQEKQEKQQMENKNGREDK